MFTGIVEEVGVVREKIPVGPAMRFRFIALRVAHGLRIGDSVSCNGVCLTAEEVTSDGFTATAVPETLSRTVLGEIEKGHIVNLEAAIKAGAPMGGHIVQGHVDGVAEVVSIRELAGGGGKELSVRIPMEFTRYCVEKGSFALHGASLTIAGVEENILRFAVVPHTLAHTNLANVGPGKRLNFEVDLVGKYVEKLLGFAGLGAADGKGRKGLDPGSLEKWGYGV
jgi:riboflavin synthase